MSKIPPPLKQRPLTPHAPGPLNGIRVVDVSRLFAGNLLTQTLADFGAEVIKLEPPEGDTLRAWRVEGIETHWKAYSRNKKSVCLDFRKPAAIALIKQLIASAAVFVESFRPGTLEKIGLGPEVLHAINAKLVIVRISGWGQTGPYAHRPGFGTLIEGMSGFASMNGFADREPVLPPMYLADAVAALSGSPAVLIALREVEVNGGKGQIIDLPLLDPLMSILGPQTANYRLTGKIKPRTGSRSTNTAPRNAYRCKDGLYVGLSASTQKMAARLLKSIGRESLIEDPRYATNEQRVNNAEALDEIIGAFIAQRTQAENVEFFDRAEVTIGPIYDISQIMHDPHIIERGIIADYPDDELGAMAMHSVVPRLSGTPGSVRSTAPALGQHNQAVLSSIGLSVSDIEQLKADGVLHG